ncbi:MAG: XrtA system polysaccharide deacetylase [Candidatus Eisenbacteria bacterium]
MAEKTPGPLNAFCVDTEEWFHVCAVDTPYMDPSTWDAAPARVERDVDVLLGLLDEAGTKGTFPTLGWLARKYPAMVRRIADQGHEVGCHGYHHRLVYEQSPTEFRTEIDGARKLLQDVSGQEVTTFRAPGFSIVRSCFWAYPILAELGFKVDTSIVPAARDHGGVAGLSRDPFVLKTDSGDLTVFPVSVMSLLGRLIPFSGGGYLRLYPSTFLDMGFAQNHRVGRPVMAYIHPREIDPGQPRMPMPFAKRFKYYVGLDTCESKLRRMLHRYRFATVPDVLAAHPPRETRVWRDDDLVLAASG